MPFLAPRFWYISTRNFFIIYFRLIGPRKDLEDRGAKLESYIPAAVQGSVHLLGPYPLPKLDFVVVSKSFSGLGLASPNLTFLSPSLLGVDTASLVKVSHEIAHAWFGILVGSKDWTEAWLSEGFATFLEYFIHQQALKLLGLEGDKGKEIK